MRKIIAEAQEVVYSIDMALARFDEGRQPVSLLEKYGINEHKPCTRNEFYDCIIKSAKERSAFMAKINKKSP